MRLTYRPLDGVRITEYELQCHIQVLCLVVGASNHYTAFCAWIRLPSWTARHFVVDETEPEAYRA